MKSSPPPLPVGPPPPATPWGCGQYPTPWVDPNYGWNCPPLHVPRSDHYNYDWGAGAGDYDWGATASAGSRSSSSHPHAFGKDKCDGKGGKKGATTGTQDGVVVEDAEKRAEVEAFDALSWLYAEDDAKDKKNE